jgi:uncharacterized protein
MHIALTGGSGLLGTALRRALAADHHRVTVLVRRPPRGSDEVRWDPAGGAPDEALLTALTGVDAIVHLAGAGVADRPWTRSYRATILDSRVGGTTVVSRIAAAVRPRVLLSASAVGYYGDTGDTVVDESAPSGRGFLAEVCRQWEAATAPAEDAGVAVSHLRTGLVLARQGGVLGRQLPLFRFGLGASLGDGRQYQPWISLTDWVGAARHLLTTPAPGPVNVVGPAPVPNRELTTAIGAALHRPAPWRVPGPLLRLGLRDLADEALLSGQRAVPGVLTATGFTFATPTLAAALERELAAPGQDS